MARRKYTTCSACGKWHEQPHPAVFKCECGSEVGRSRTSTNAAWGNTGGKSLRYAFDPKSRESLAATAPATARAIKDDGTLVYESESHQKRVFKEFSEAKERSEAEQAPRIDLNTARFLNAS